MKKKIPLFTLIVMVLTMSALPVSATEQLNIVPTENQIVIEDMSVAPIEPEASTFEEPIVPDVDEDENLPTDKPVNIETYPEIDLDIPPTSEIVTLNIEVDVEVLADASGVISISELKEIDGSGSYALSNDIVNEFITIEAGWDVTFDFNGYTISVNTGRPFTNNGSLTLIATNGGGVENAPGTGFGAVSNNAGAMLTVNSGTYSSNNNGSGIRNLAGGTAIVNGGTFNDIRAIANAGAVTINGGTFNQVTNSAYTIFSDGTSLVINNAVVNGMNGGVALSKGYLEINNGTFTAETHYPLYINKESTGGPFTVNINGGSFNSANSVALYLQIKADEATNSVKINGGTFTGGKGAANIVNLLQASEDGYPTPVISGGTFVGSDVNQYVASAKLQNLGDISPEWTVVERTYKANIEDGKFGSLSDKFVANESVSIVASVAPSGFIFDKWISQDVEFANESSPSTSFIMPEKEVTVKATYKEAPATVIPPKTNFETVYVDNKGPLTATIEKPEGDFLYITIKVKNAPQARVALLSSNDSYTEFFVDPSNYTVCADGTTITLHEDFLQTLGGGEYLVSAVFSGGIATLPLEISEESAPVQPSEEVNEPSETTPEVNVNEEIAQPNNNNSNSNNTNSNRRPTNASSNNNGTAVQTSSIAPLPEARTVGEKVEEETPNAIVTTLSSNDANGTQATTVEQTETQNNMIPFIAIAIAVLAFAGLTAIRVFAKKSKNN